MDLIRIKNIFELQRLQTFSDRDTISFSVDYIEWLIKQAEKVELLKVEVEERLRNANNLDEHDVAFELSNLLETINS